MNKERLSSIFPESSVNRAMRNSLMGNTRRREQLALAQLTADHQAGLPYTAERVVEISTSLEQLLSKGLTLNHDRLNSLAGAEAHDIQAKIREAATLGKVLTSNELTEAGQLALNAFKQGLTEIQPPALGQRRELLVLSSILLALLLAGLLYTTADAAIPTVTPTPTEQVGDEVESLIPTPTTTPKKVEAPTATPTPEVKKETIVTSLTTTNLNARTGPGTSYDAEIVIPEGIEVVRLGEPQNSWVQISFELNGKEYGKTKKLYVSVEFLTEPKTVTIEVPAEDEDGNVTETQPITSTETITPTSVMTGEVDTEAVGGVVSDTELLAKAREIFTDTITVELNVAGTHPIAKVDKYVVGEFLNGEWQHIREIHEFTDEQLRYYPDLVEKKVDGKTVLVQTTFDKDVVVAEQTAEGKWIQPTRTSYELTVLAQELGIETEKVSKTDSEAQQNLEASAYEYNIDTFPSMEEDQGQPERSLIVRGIANQGFQVLELPIKKKLGEKWNDTGWKLGIVVLPVSSVDTQGNWYTDNISVEVVQSLTNGDKTYWQTWMGEKYEKYMTTYSTLPDGFRENMIYLNSLPATALKDIDLPDGSPIALYVYSVTTADTPEYQADLQSLVELLNEFDFSKNTVPTQDQIDFIGSSLTRGWREDFRVPLMDTLNDEVLSELMENGKDSNLDYYGGLAALQKIVVKEKK